MTFNPMERKEKVFTEEDLKRLKDIIADYIYVNVGDDDYGDPNEFDLKALIARLEASEKALDFADGAIYSVYDPGRHDCPLCDNFMSPCKEDCDFPKLDVAFKTWKRSKGE